MYLLTLTREWGATGLERSRRSHGTYFTETAATIHGEGLVTCNDSKLCGSITYPGSLDIPDQCTQSTEQSLLPRFTQLRSEGIS